MDDKIIAVIKSLKAGKAPGADNLHPEFFLQIHENCIQWLQSFFNVCLHTNKVPKIWKLAKVVSVLKPKKPPNQFARIHTSSLIKIEKTLNRPITKFYNDDDVNVIVAELQLTKTRPTSFNKKHNLL